MILGLSLDAAVIGVFSFFLVSPSLTVFLSLLSLSVKVHGWLISPTGIRVVAGMVLCASIGLPTLRVDGSSSGHATHLLVVSIPS